jgi:hypothetical protein
LSEITSEPLIKKDQIKLLVSNFENVDDFLVKMKERGYDFNVYLSSDNPQSTSAFNEHEVIWLGHLVPLDDIKAVVKLSKTIYPHLKYVKVFYEDICHDEIYIGGSTSSALEIYYCSPLSDTEFELLLLEAKEDYEKSKAVQELSFGHLLLDPTTHPEFAAEQFRILVAQLRLLSKAVAHAPIVETLSAKETSDELTIKIAQLVAEYGKKS